MDAREDILTAIRARGQGPREIPHIPDFSRGPGDLVGLFTEALARLDGQVVSQAARGHPGVAVRDIPRRQEGLFRGPGGARNDHPG